VILIGLDKPGQETITRLRKVLPGVGIIALTLLEGAAHRKAAMTAGADDVVLKTELTTDLLPAIRRVMQANRSPRLARVRIAVGGVDWRQKMVGYRILSDMASYTKALPYSKSHGDAIWEHSRTAWKTG
jgi:DNA-binding NarL/FixJ family response regulator